MLGRPAMNVVVYRDPGPSDEEIDRHAQQMIEERSMAGPGGGLGYLTLVVSDFKRLWEGVSRGDAHGAAYSVLKFLGPNAQQFIGRPDDFIYGWVGLDEHETPYGRVLLLQIIPRPELLARMGLN